MNDDLAIWIPIIAIFAPLFIFMLVVTPILNNEQNNAQQSKVLSTFLKDGNTACSYKVGLNQDYDYPCPYHTGDSITVYQDGFGGWHIKRLGVVGN